MSFPPCDLVVGIAQGGIAPATLIAYILGRELRIVHFNFRNQDNTPVHPQPVLLNEITIPAGVKRILLVDDVSVSGKTLKAAKDLLAQYEVTSFVLRGKADYVLFPEIDYCVKWPWKV